MLSTVIIIRSREWSHPLTNVHLVSHYHNWLLTMKRKHTHPPPYNFSFIIQNIINNIRLVFFVTIKILGSHHRYEEQREKNLIRDFLFKSDSEYVCGLSKRIKRDFLQQQQQQNKHTNKLSSMHQIKWIVKNVMGKRYWNIIIIIIILIE